MKKFVTLSAFVFLLVLSLIAKRTHAQAQGTLVLRPVVVVKSTCKPVHGYWKWNRRKHAHIWVDARRIHPHKVHRMRHW